LVRQAHSYFAGAVSSTVLIVSALFVFVLLVSVQAFRAWPLPGLGLGGRVAVSATRRPASDRRAPAAAAPAAAATSGGGGSGPAVDAAGRPNPGRSGAIGPQGGLSSRPPAPTGDKPPGASGPTTGGGRSSGPSPAPLSSGGSGSTEAGGESGSIVGSPGAAVAGDAGSTVSKVDEAAAGTLGDTGAPTAAEGVVNGVGGPESIVGHAVGETVGVVGGLLPPHR